MSLINSLTPTSSHICTLCSGSKEVEHFSVPGQGSFLTPQPISLSQLLEEGASQNPKHPFFVFLLQGSGADDKRRTLTPLALRYSILSESTLGINLFVMIRAHSLSKEV